MWISSAVKEAHPRTVKVYPGAKEAYSGVLKVLLRSVEAHSGTLEAHLGDVEVTWSPSGSSRSCGGLPL